MILQTISEELIGSRTALAMATLTKIAYNCSLRDRIDFEKLPVLERSA